MSEVRLRTISGSLYVREAVPYAHDLKIHNLGLHCEGVAIPRYRWSEVDALSPLAAADAESCIGKIFVDGEWLPAPPPSDNDKLGYASENRERSARRARSAVRRRVKLFELSTMLTLTYAENVLERERIRRDVDVMLKRIKRLIPDFSYVCVFERQKRGAWHAHIACKTVQSHYFHRGKMVQSYALLRAMWRAVVGVRGGNIDVSRGRAVKRSTGRLSGYLSKYIGKGLADGEPGDSYSASGKLPRPDTTRFLGGNLQDAGQELIRLAQNAFKGMCEFYAMEISETAYFCSLSPL